MIVINTGLGKGLTNNFGKLTLDFDNSVPVTKENGVFINKSVIGESGVSKDLPGIIDGYTVKKYGVDTYGNPVLRENQDVVVNIYTMAYGRRTNMSLTSENYLSNIDSTKAKSPSDIVNEFNCLLDNGIKSTTYKLKAGDLLQFRTIAIPIDKRNSVYKWDYAIDDSNRYQDDVIVAMFFVKSVEYDGDETGQAEYHSSYMKKLTIRCVWLSEELSTMQYGTSGQSYLIGSTYVGVGQR